MRCADDRRLGPPLDNAGPPPKANRDYALYLMRRGVPGPDRCSRRAVDTVRSLEGPDE